MSRVAEQIALPTEGLAIFGRLLGLLCALDALSRIPDAAFFLSDFGVFPRLLYFTLFDDRPEWSAYNISGRPEFAVALLVLTALLGICQALGISRPLTRLVLWFLIASVQVRNPALVYSEDLLLRDLLFWNIFLPSFDTGEGGDVHSPATLGLQIHLTIVFLMLARHLSPEYYRLAATGLPAPIHWWSWADRATLALACGGLWWARSRTFVLGAVGVLLTARAFLVDPVLSVVVLTGLSCLYKPSGRECRPRRVGRRWQFGVVVTLGSLILASSLRFSPATSWARLVALEEDWNRTFPADSQVKVGLVVRASDTDRTVWTVTEESGRREQGFARAIALEPLWAHNLSRALKRRLHTESALRVFLVSQTVSENDILEDPVVQPVPTGD